MAQYRTTVAVALVAIFCFSAAHAGPLEALKDGWRWATGTQDTARRVLQQADEVFLKRVFTFRTLVRSGLKIDGLEPVDEGQRSAAAGSVRTQTQNSVLGLLVRVVPEAYPGLAGLKPTLVKVVEDPVTTTRSGGVPDWAEELETRSGQTWNTTDCESATALSQDFVESTYQVESTNRTLRHSLELYRSVMGNLTTDVMKLTNDICGIVALGFTYVDEFGIPETIPAEET